MFKRVHPLSLRLGINPVVEWHKPKLSVAQQQKKPPLLEKEMQLQKKVLKLKRGNDRTYFLFLIGIIMNIKCKNCKKDFDEYEERNCS